MVRNFPPLCELTSTETSRRARADPGSPSVKITVSLGSSAAHIRDKVSVDAILEAKVKVRVNVEVEVRMEIKVEDSHGHGGRFHHGLDPCQRIAQAHWGNVALQDRSNFFLSSHHHLSPIFAEIQSVRFSCV